MIEIAKEVLQTEANALLEAKVDENFTEAVEKIYATKGKVIVVGVGKSGLVGAKIAATLASTGTSSFFLHPTEAMHGDLGMIGKEDLVLAISYSGESEELVQILPHIKRFNIPLIAMAKTSQSTLGRYCDLFLSIFVEKEACPLDAAPTSSTTLTMALGDALAVALMKKRGFKHDDFASFHPGGALGKRLFVKIKDLMRKENLPIIDKQTKLKDAIVVMSQGKLGNVLITQNDEFCAVLSDGDLRRALIDKDFDLQKSAYTYATKNPKVIEDENILASQALAFIEEHKIQLLVVTKNKKIAGAVHLHDLVEAGIK
jgi:arabinose-5-phosphate isomerase